MKKEKITPNNSHPPIFFCNTSTSLKGRNPKNRNEVFYLDRIKELGCEFDKLEAFCTDGDIRPPYPYQWRATTKIIEGADDPFEGLGDTPIKALRELTNEVKAQMEYIPNDEEDF